MPSSIKTKGNFLEHFCGKKCVLQGGKYSMFVCTLCQGNASATENRRDTGACLSTGFEEYKCKKYLIYNSYYRMYLSEK